MTGFATNIIHLPAFSIQLDIRSINHRFFDLTIKSPDDFKQLESVIRNKIVNTVARGKIEFRILIKTNDLTTTNLIINQKRLDEYIDFYAQIQTKLPQLPQSSVTDIMNLPGIIEKETFELDNIHDTICTEIDKLCEQLLHSLHTEGDNLSKILLDKITQIEATVKQSLEILPELYASYKLKLKQRMAEVFEDGTVNEQRFHQEIAYFCQKSDVDEELTRLLSHSTQFRTLIAKGGAVGKKIDFLTQEMLREANTFGSKSISLITTENSVLLKVLIEQIKEQIQNIA